MAACRSIDSNRLPGCWPNLHPKAWKRKETQPFASPVFCRYRPALLTGIIWNALPRETFEGPGSAMIRPEFRQWAKAGVFQNIRRGILAECDGPTGIGRHWQAADGTNIEAPPAQESIDPSPKDPGKNGCKRRVLAGGHGVLCHLPSAAPTGVRACRSIPCSRPD